MTIEVMFNFIIENLYYIILLYILIDNYLKLEYKHLILSAVNIFFIIDIFFSFLNYIFNINYSIYYIIQSLFLFYFLFCKLFSYIKSDEINNNNVLIIFYKPKKIKQFILSIFGLSYSSAGLIINKNIYQMRYEAKTLQKIPFTDKTLNYLKEKYLIIDTGFNFKNLNGDWEKNLLSQHARQKRTFYFRFNCLRSLRYVLNQIKGYEYKSEYIFPCIYLLILKIKKFRK